MEAAQIYVIIKTKQQTTNGMAMILELLISRKNETLWVWSLHSISVLICLQFNHNSIVSQNNDNNGNTLITTTYHKKQLQPYNNITDSNETITVTPLLQLQKQLDNNS